MITINLTETEKGNTFFFTVFTIVDKFLIQFDAAVNLAGGHSKRGYLDINGRDKRLKYN